VRLVVDGRCGLSISLVIATLDLVLCGGAGCKKSSKKDTEEDSAGCKKTSISWTI